MQIDSTNTDFPNWLNSWFSPVVIIATLTLLFYLVKHFLYRKETKPRINDAHINESSFRTFSFLIANNRNNSITVLRIYYRIFYLGFIPSRKYRFKNSWEYPTNKENPLFKKTVIEKEQSFIIPLANDELILNRKHKIYVKTSGGLCKAIARPWLHSLVQDLEEESKNKI